MTRRTCSLVGRLGISIFDIMALGLHHIESTRERSLYVRARLLQAVDLKLCVLSRFNNASKHGKLKYSKGRLFRPACIGFMQRLNRSYLGENRLL
jgi:hypothetical protein